ncbi:MAG TPA: nuclear transport factor 2 family protein [Gammaproteobacteria bacterium]
MRTRTTLCTLAVLALSGAAFAQTPVVGVDDPESLFVDDDPAIHRNKQAALHIMRELLQCGQWDRAGEWLTERYIQHNPNAADGLDAVVTFFTEVLKQPRTDNCGELTTPVVKVVGEDDIVVVMIAREYDDPRRPGQKYSTTWFDAWRFVDGKADEHWDAATIMQGN